MSHDATTTCSYTSICVSVEADLRRFSSDFHAMFAEPTERKFEASFMSSSFDGHTLKFIPDVFLEKQNMQLIPGGVFEGVPNLKFVSCGYLGERKT